MDTMKVIKAAQTLGAGECCIRGTVANETEFYANFYKVTGVNSDGTAAETNDPAVHKIAWADIQTEVAKLDKLDYQTNRVFNPTGTTYATVEEQLDMLYHDIEDGKLNTSGTWATHVKAVKDANPKPS